MQGDTFCPYKGMKDYDSSLLDLALAPLAPWLSDQSIIEIMVNPDGSVWIERAQETMIKVSDIEKASIERIIRLLASSYDTEISRKKPSLSVKLPRYGMRVQALVSPIVSGASLVLRRPAQKVYRLASYVERGALSEAEAAYLRDAVRCHQNIIIAGGTGSGKTTFANALLAEVAEHERIYIIEDTQELRCEIPNRVEVCVQSPIYDHARAIRDALRSRPDRMVIGEVRDGSALDLVKAWNTGHPGGIATIHASSAALALDRLCQLIEERVAQAPRSLIAETIDLIIFVERDDSGWQVRELSRVLGYDERSSVTRGWKLEPVAKPQHHTPKTERKIGAQDSLLAPTEGI